ncbi:MAG: hypothetical protein ACTSPK_00100 [Candidatus Heimdallarchaeota archaeon]
MDRNFALFIVLLWMIFCFGIGLVLMAKWLKRLRYVVIESEKEFQIFSETIKQFKQKDEWNDLVGELKLE